MLNNNCNSKVIKQIGKGSFSDVYLCTRQSNNDITLSNLEYSLFSNLFIIKRININSLVEQYISKERFNELAIKQNKSTTGLNKSTFAFTPPNINYNMNNVNSNNLASFSSKILKGSEYYRKKLTDVIHSEIRILKLLYDGSENIVKYYDHEIYENDKGHKIYDIYLEYCTGGDLYSYLKDGDTTIENRNSWGGFNKRFLYQFINQISNGLQFIHDSNLIHRDIKLQNILINFNLEKRDVIFKISDLGFACYDVSKLKLNTQQNTQQQNNDNTDYLVSKYYRICGTPYYMAPEILNKNKLEIDYDSRIDIWSLGISIYQLIWNRLPFLVKSVKQLESLYTNTSNLIIETPGVSENIVDILNYTICIDRKLRYTAQKLKQICKDIQGYDHWEGDNKPMNELLIEKQTNKGEDDWEKISQLDSDYESRNLKNLDLDKSFLDWMKGGG